MNNLINKQTSKSENKVSETRGQIDE